ncbi:MAG: acyltransferase family protein [Gemmatimonadaceae bacterium]
MSAQDPARSEYRTDLEGLRGVAIILVVLFHVGLATTAGGFVGVDVFFVLSGFFITVGLLRESTTDGQIGLGTFFAKRALRLLPVLLLVLLTTLIAVMTLYAPIDREAIAKTARAVALGSANSSFASEAVDYFSAGENPLLHTWSLAVEQQFYFVWPLLFVLVGVVANRFGKSANSNDDLAQNVAAARKRLLLVIAVVAVISFGASLWLTKSAQPKAFFSMSTRLWEFALGAVVAVVLGAKNSWMDARAQWIQLAGLAAIALPVFTYSRATAYPGVAALLPALGAVALLVGGQFAPTSFVSRTLATPLLCWFGRISYAWYLWHWPIIGIAGVLSPGLGVVGKLAWCVAALLLAWLTYRFVEQPARNGALSFIPVHRVSLVAFGATLVAALVAQIAVFVAQRSAGVPAQQLFAAARDDRMHHDCWSNTAEDAKGPCEFGDKTSSTTVVLFGDSHAEHWLGGLDRVGRERGWKIVVMVKGGCPVPDMPELLHARYKRNYIECTRYREAMLQRIVAMKPAIALLSSWDHYMPANGETSDWKVTPEMWQSGLRRTYARLSAAGVPVVAMRGTPRTWFNTPGCLSRREARVMFATTCEYERSNAFVPGAVDAQNTAARGLSVRFVDMNDLICASARCSVMPGKIVVFTDDNHLTATFSKSVAAQLGARVANASAQLGVRLP